MRCNNKKTVKYMILIILKCNIKIFYNVTGNIMLPVTFSSYYLLPNKPLFFKYVTKVTAVTLFYFTFSFNIKVHHNIGIKNI